ITPHGGGGRYTPPSRVHKVLPFAGRRGKRRDDVVPQVGLRPRRDLESVRAFAGHDLRWTAQRVHAAEETVRAHPVQVDANLQARLDAMQPQLDIGGPIGNETRGRLEGDLGVRLVGDFGRLLLRWLRVQRGVREYGVLVLAVELQSPPR